MGRGSSQMLELYCHLADEDSQRAMAALAGDEFQGEGLAVDPNLEGNLRATGGSTTPAQVPELQQLVECVEQSAERAGFDLPDFCNLCRHLCLRLNSKNDKEFERLVDVLYLHDFIPSRDAF